MKTFLRVIYTKILYRIPLKFLLVLLVIIAVFVASFSSASEFPTSSWEGANDLDSNGYWIFNQSVSNSSSTYYTLRSDVQFVCLRCPTTSCSNRQYSFDGTNWSNLSFYSILCTDKPFYTKGGEIFIYPFLKEWYILPQQYSSLQCQTEYNLIPISSVDQNYCTTNNLCPSCETCPVCPVGTGGISSLYINNILHVGAPIINMTIPEEIDWDYEYTMGGNNMNIDVAGYNVDYEKMQDIIDLQNYVPNEGEFTQLIGLLAPYTKIIIFFVFLMIVWGLMKKTFKS